MEDDPVAKGAWVVSLDRGKTPQTLHRVGECFRTPGVHFKNYMILSEDEVLGDEPALQPPYDRVCRDCFPRGMLATEEPSSSEEEEN
jgi:hypothetical protein